MRFIFQMSELTEAQEQAFDQIEAIMREHFEAAVFAIETSAKDDDDDTIYKVTSHGTYASALGLCDIAKEQIRESTPKEKT